MKKLIALILALAMTLSLVACGSNTQNVTTDTEAASAPEASASASASASEEAEASAEASAETSAPVESAAESEVETIKANGKLVVGITDFAPMDYQDESGEWIGFDADMAHAFAESLGVEVEFIEIDWDNKIFELNGKTIDCVWNGMTLTDEVEASMECTAPYLNNSQVVVMPADKADQYADEASLADLSFAAESGSAGEAVLNEKGLNVTPVLAQADALMEVAAGTSDAAVVDILMAYAMVGEGTSYADLTYTLPLSDEEYVVGFRKGSDLAAALDTFLTENADLVASTAAEYELTGALIAE
ncbi:MAG: transporter substrate-binding domain-containing protein [Oscillospiraceae bacterium]|nr:transporter substrate-binding domain-containing protein [Oscillospiraceae bacterium]